MLIAFDTPTLTWTPAEWTRLDTGGRVASFTIDRGRTYELDQTDTGRATVEINDRDGLLNPVNPAGPYYGLLEPLLQVLLQRYNPVTDTWHTRFRGFISDYDYVYDPSQQVTRLVLSLVDLFEVLSMIQMEVGAFGNPSPPSVSEDQVWFATAAMDDRVFTVLDQASIPADYYVVFTGNVDVQPTVYSPGEPVLTAVQEAATAEFPGVSNVYVDRLGRLAVHGRLARFNPEDTSAGASVGAWFWTSWRAGDAEEAAATPGTARIKEFAFNRGLSKIINQALATPMRPSKQLTQAQRAAQLVDDAPSQAKYGIRSWSAEDLLTQHGYFGTGTTALQETRKFGEYYVENYKEPKNRITQIGFRTVRPGTLGATPTWELLCELDITDELNVTVSGAGAWYGFNNDLHFVEGIHEQSQPLNPTYDDVTMTLDLSPRSFFSEDPWS